MSWRAIGFRVEDPGAKIAWQGRGEPPELPLPSLWRLIEAPDAGWRLALAPSPADVAPVGFWRRVARGWRRLVGEPDQVMPPTLVAAVASPEDAQRLVHVFTPGTAVLVGGRPAAGSVTPTAGAAAVTVRP